jgi:hypothetical protein
MGTEDRMVFFIRAASDLLFVGPNPSSGVTKIVTPDLEPSQFPKAPLNQRHGSLKS